MNNYYKSDSTFKYFWIVMLALLVVGSYFMLSIKSSENNKLKYKCDNILTTIKIKKHLILYQIKNVGDSTQVIDKSKISEDWLKNTGRIYFADQVIYRLDGSPVSMPTSDFFQEKIIKLKSGETIKAELDIFDLLMYLSKQPEISHFFINGTAKYKLSFWVNTQIVKNAIEQPSKATVLTTDWLIDSISKESN